MRKRLFGSLSLGVVTTAVLRAWGILGIARDVMSWAENDLLAGIDVAAITIEIGVLLIVALIFGVIIWTIVESSFWAARTIRDRLNDGPARRRFQACLADIDDCRRSIEDASFPTTLFIHSDLYAKLTILSERLQALGIACRPVDRGDPALVAWHIRLRALAVYVEHGDIEAARRHRRL